jgi:acetyl esterase/lipase
MPISLLNANRAARSGVALLLALAGPVVSAHAQAPRRLRAGDIDTMTLATTGQRIAYGTDSLQFGDLRLPAAATAGARVPLVIVVHGGCWIAGYASLRNAAPLADALAARGVASWNVEYRRTDHPGGGWPGTFRDVAMAADYVRTLVKLHPIDTTRIVIAGHSAGGHLALWLATRRALAPTSDLAVGTPLPITGVVSIGGIGDLREFAGRPRDGCNIGVEKLLGGAPDNVPTHLAAGSPIARLPLHVPSVHIAGDADGIAPVAVREAFAAAATKAGDQATVVTVPGGHFEPMAPSTLSGQAVMEAILALLNRKP